jgi:hypothetical protein
MANGRDCPVCGKDIGVWSVVTAGLPNRIRCPHCRAVLRYDGMITILALPFVIVILAALVIHEVAVDVGIAVPGVVLVLVVLLTWIPVELFIALYLRDHRTLHRVEGKAASR